MMEGHLWHIGLLRFMYSDGGSFMAYRVLRFMHSDGGSFRAYRVFMFMYSDGGSFMAYIYMGVHKKNHKTVQVMVLTNKFLICVSNF